MKRCHWCTNDPDYIAYHDAEWGTPSRDPRHLFEMLLLEGFQAGLSWITVLKKRPRYRQVLFGFDPGKVAAMSDDYIENTLMRDAGIIRNRLKLNAARRNARAWLTLDDPVETMWSFTQGHPLVNHYARHEDIPLVTPQAESMSRVLKKAGFTFVGPTICQSYLQAIGCIMDHTTDCFRYTELARP
ncbi:DNA-3-methyladenine glycosylase I [Allopusillimonas soli]|uniref:DNA-3-methyladenine glycosylase I n=1 Tax=Allopusillimonas soli TaxID=659016 RepID=A0A853FD15_9BURK|nr:DNA-3-methyladenine glycosylase I [Allopusillimonas soli]NYT37837.1 DNA-3-methyladenine glycosylase I [Allopusillimonas soli]TEA73742.1 DNA-3-methyladenine glycosylase I [Allopusillimonas soli]